jgi:hypothetical protein
MYDIVRNNLAALMIIDGLGAASLPRYLAPITSAVTAARNEARLHIPAGILRIPVFSVPIACFSQESQFFLNKKEQKPLQ